MPDQTHPNTRLILLPGMAADWRLFTHQIKVFETLEIPPWLPTRRNETLAAYAQRMAASLSPSEPYFLGGASLGGMLALEMVRHLHPAPRGIFLIGSCRHGLRVVPVTLRRARIINPLIPTLLFDWFKLFVVPLRKNRLTTEQRKIFSDMYRDTPGSFVEWASTAIVRWPGVTHVDVPVYHIHGSRDRILPLRGVRPDHVIPGGGHLISLSHPEDVNTFIRERMAATLSQR